MSDGISVVVPPGQDPLKVMSKHIFAALSEGLCPRDGTRLTTVNGTTYGQCGKCLNYWASCTNHPDRADWEWAQAIDVTMTDLYGIPRTHYADLGPFCTINT